MVDQVNEDGTFDEHKALPASVHWRMLDRGYHENYAEGCKAAAPSARCPGGVKAWARSGKLKEPLGELAAQEEAIRCEITRSRKESP